MASLRIPYLYVLDNRLFSGHAHTQKALSCTSSYRYSYLVCHTGVGSRGGEYHHLHGWPAPTAVHHYIEYMYVLDKKSPFVGF